MGYLTRPDISTIFYLEYKISNLLNSALRIDVGGLNNFKEKSISHIRNFLFKYGYVNEEATAEFNLIWNLFYAYTNFFGVKTTSGEIGRNILSEDYNYISRKLRDGNTIRSDTIERLRDALEKLPLNSHTQKAIDYLDFYLQFRGIKDNPTHYDYRWDNLFWIHCYELLKFQKGIELFTGELLPDDNSKFVRHHIHYNKSSIKLYDITLSTLGTHNQISHPMRMGLSKDPKLDREKILHAIGSISAEIPRKPVFWNEGQWDYYLQRDRELYEKGEDYFFQTYYKFFYNSFLQNLPPENMRFIIF